MTHKLADLLRLSVVRRPRLLELGHLMEPTALALPFRHSSSTALQSSTPLAPCTYAILFPTPAPCTPVI